MTLKNLRDQGNTVLVVEHDEDAIRSADYVVDIGPGAGVHGGFIVAQGTPEEILADYPDLEREDISACLAFAARLASVHRILPLAA